MILVDWDIAALMWLNGIAGRSMLLDGAIVFLSGSELRGAVMVGLLWWAWFNGHARIFEERLFWIRTMIGTLIAISIGRALQNLLPRRLRPLHDSSLEFESPFWMSDATLAGWSSFPSDHAVLFAALTTAIFLVDRTIGALAILWLVAVILVPRIYLGLHYPSDILFGALIGTAVMLVSQRLHAPRRLAPVVQSFEANHRGLAFASLLVFGFLCATLFEGIREIVSALSLAIAATGPP